MVAGAVGTVTVAKRTGASNGPNGRQQKGASGRFLDGFWVENSINTRLWDHFGHAKTQRKVHIRTQKERRRSKAIIRDSTTVGSREKVDTVTVKPTV